ncbi:MAG: DUF6920 family protein [Burkholderiales bacterium]
MRTMIDTGHVPWSMPPLPNDPVSARDWAGLPDPVATFFRRALPFGERPATSVRIEQEGAILLGRRWRAFTATHVMSAGPPAFAWDARVKMAPMLHVTVRDSLIDGVGSMRADFGRLFTVARQEGGCAMNAGALHRYLAEATWMPSALLPRFGIAWRPVDASRAVATLAEDKATVSLEFTFNGVGEVTRVFTPVRFRATKGRFEPTPWMGTFTNYAARHGMWVPTEAEVSWQIDGEWQACWRGRNIGSKELGK